ncbi:AAEL006749-PA [Aedes aegypti]|uniref:AAEL006749-PA n=1 Tax=Aedes aegypti TaxID=7159 RepID=Q175A1_AEDAE|nr:AAEL006749-PA [Aedes aegypti]
MFLFHPAYSPYNGADSGQRARQYAGYGVYGGGSGPFGTRSLNGGSQFGYGGYYTPGFHNNAQSYGGLGGESYDARSLGGGSLGGGAVGAGSLGGGLGSRSLGGGYVGNGAGAGAGGLQAGGGLGSNFDGSSLGNHPQGGSPSEPNSSSLGPGSIASRSPIGGSLDAGALNRRTPADGTSALGSTDGIGSSTGSNPFGTNAFGRSPQQIGSVYGGIPSYATNPALGRTFGYPRIPLAFVYTTPRSFIAPSVTSTPINGVGTNRFPNNDGRSTTRGNQFQDDAGIRDLGAAGPNTGYRPTGGNAATTPNGLPNQIASSSQNSRPGSQTNPQNDGTYNFAYRTPDSTRQESADGQGNVHGSYAFRNANGNHDLSFVAGPNTGFQPTGGSLAVPNGLGQGRSNVNGSPVSPVASTAVRNDNNGGNGLGDPSRHGSGIGQNNNGAQNSGSNGEALNGGRSGNDQRLLSDGTGSGSAIGGNLGAGGPNVFQQTGLRGLDGNLGSSGSTGNHGNGLANTGFGGNGGGPLSNGNGQSGEGTFGGNSGSGTQSTTGNQRSPSSGSSFNRGNGLTNTGSGVNGGGSLSNTNGQSVAGNSGGHGTQLTDGNSGSLSSTSSTLNRGNGFSNSEFGNIGAGSISNSYGQSVGEISGGTLGSSSGSTLNRGNGLTNAGFRNNNGGSSTGSSSFGTASANLYEGGNGSYGFSNDGRKTRQGNRNGRLDGQYSYLSGGSQQSLRYRVHKCTVASTAVRNDNNGGNGLGDPSRHGSGIGQNNNGAQNSGSNGEALNGGRSVNDQRLLSDGTGSGSAIGGNLGAGGPNVFQQTGLRGLDGNLGSSGSTGNHGNGLANTGFGGNGGGPLSNGNGQSGEGTFGGNSGSGTQSTTGNQRSPSSGSSFNRGNGLTNTGSGVNGGGSLSNTNGQSVAGNSGGHGTQLTDGNSGSLSSTSSTLNRGNGFSNSEFGNIGAGSISNSYGQSVGEISGGTLGSSSGSTLNRGNGLTNAGFRNNNGGSSTGSSSFGTASANLYEGGNGSYGFSNDGRKTRQGNRNGRLDGQYSYLSGGSQQSLRYRVRPETSFEANRATKTAIPK